MPRSICYTDPYDLEYRTVTTTDDIAFFTVVKNKSILDEHIKAKLMLPPERIPGTYLRDKLLNEILSPQANKKEETTRTTNKLPPWKSERVTVEGQTLLKFYREYALYGEGVSKQTIWANPETHRIVRTELRATDRKGKRHYYDVREQFRYDEEPPAGIFDVRPSKADVTNRKP